MSYRHWVTLDGEIYQGGVMPRYGLNLPFDLEIPFRQAWMHRGLTIGQGAGKIAGGDRMMLVTHGKAPIRYCRALHADTGAVLRQYSTAPGHEILTCGIFKNHIWVQVRTEMNARRWSSVIISPTSEGDVCGLFEGTGAITVHDALLAHAAEDESALLFEDGTEVLISDRLLCRKGTRPNALFREAHEWRGRFIILPFVYNDYAGTQALSVYSSLNVGDPEWTYTFGHDLPDPQRTSNKQWRLHHISDDAMIAWQDSNNNRGTRLGVFDVRTGSMLCLLPWGDLGGREVTSDGRHLYVAGSWFDGEPCDPPPPPKGLKAVKPRPVHLRSYDLASGDVQWEVRLPSNHADHIYALVRLRTQLLVVTLAIEGWEVQVRDAANGKLIDTLACKGYPGFGIAGQRVVCLDGRTVRAYACA